MNPYQSPETKDCLTEEEIDRRSKERWGRFLNALAWTLQAICAVTAIFAFRDAIYSIRPWISIQAPISYTCIGLGFLVGAFIPSLFARLERKNKSQCLTTSKS